MSMYEIAATGITTNDATIPLSERTIYLDLCGMRLQQNVLDIVTAQAGSEPGPVNIILRRIGTSGGVPRVIVDSASIYDAVVLLLSERELADRLDSGMTADERGKPYTADESKRVAETYPDEYVREVVQFLLRRIERLTDRKKI